jgi:hypothetical protein
MMVENPDRERIDMTRFPTLAALGLAVLTLIAACAAPAGSTAPATTAPAATGPAASATSPAGSVAPGASTALTVGNINANTASEAELRAAFEAAGISNAAKWAKEVAEYRPYAADPTWATLRQELGKYNIDPAVLEGIIALLQV